MTQRRPPVSGARSKDSEQQKGGGESTVREPVPSLTFTADQTAREAAARVLAEAGALLSSSLDRQATLAAVADLIVPALADWFVLYLFDDAKRLVPVVSKHMDSIKREKFAEYQRRYPALGQDSLPGQVVSSGHSLLFSSLSDDVLAASARDEWHLQFLRSLGMRSTMVVPLVARGRQFGAISLVADKENRPYDGEDLRLAEELARRIGLALDNVALFDEARTAADRTARLQAATAAFARALTAEQAARVVLTQGLATLTASAGVVYLTDPSETRLIATAWHGISEAAFAAWMTVPIDSSMLVSDAVRNRAPIYAPSREQTLNKYPVVREANRLVQQESWAAIPLIQDQRALGALALGFSEGRDFAPEDRALIEAVAQQCAQALDRARLFESERVARSAAERLQALTAALSEAASEASVGDAVMQHGVTALGAYAGVLAMFTPDEEELELHNSVGYPEAACMSVGRRWPIVTNITICEAVRTGEAVFIDSPDAWVKRYQGGYTPNRGASASAAWAAIPLRVGGARRGALLWTYDQPHVFGPDEQALMVAVARQCSQSLDRARLFDAERAARARADEANRAKTEFLAVMSHELRTPLNAIAGYAELLDIGVHGPLTDGQREAIERIQRSQRHLLGLINDVLNFARIEAGRVELDLRPLPLHDSLLALETLVSPLLEKKRLRYRYEPCDPDLVVRADSEKVRQILLNLLSNAIKFTESRGEIVVGCRADASAAHIMVRDTGVGIPPDKLERIFEPFVQLDTGRTRAHEGTGLGLSISRDLARAMGGDLTVASVVDEGSTFTLRMPREAPPR